VQLQEVALDVDGRGGVGLALGQVLEQHVGDEVDASAEGAVVVVEALGGDGVVLEGELLELSGAAGTFLRRVMVSSSMTLASPRGLCLRLEIAIFSPCFLELLRISSISSYILLYAIIIGDGKNWDQGGLVGEELRS
jgi:hypothetical protein